MRECDVRGQLYLSTYGDPTLSTVGSSACYPQIYYALGVLKVLRNSKLFED